MFPPDKEVLLWAKRLFPDAVKLVACDYACRFPVSWYVMSATGNRLAVAAASDDDPIPWFMPTGSTELEHG